MILAVATSDGRLFLLLCSMNFCKLKLKLIILLHCSSSLQTLTVYHRQHTMHWKKHAGRRPTSMLGWFLILVPFIRLIRYNCCLLWTLRIIANYIEVRVLQPCPLFSVGEIRVSDSTRVATKNDSTWFESLHKWLGLDSRLNFSDSRLDWGLDHCDSNSSRDSNHWLIIYLFL